MFRYIVLTIKKKREKKRRLWVLATNLKLLSVKWKKRSFYHFEMVRHIKGHWYLKKKWIIMSPFRLLVDGLQ